MTNEWFPPTMLANSHAGASQNKHEILADIIFVVFVCCFSGALSGLCKWSVCGISLMTFRLLRAMMRMWWLVSCVFTFYAPYALAYHNHSHLIPLQSQSMNQNLEPVQQNTTSWSAWIDIKVQFAYWSAATHIELLPYIARPARPIPDHKSRHWFDHNFKLKLFVVCTHRPPENQQKHSFCA